MVFAGQAAFGYDGFFVGFQSSVVSSSSEKRKGLGLADPHNCGLGGQLFAGTRVKGSRQKYVRTAVVERRQNPIHHPRRDTTRDAALLW